MIKIRFLNKLGTILKKSYDLTKPFCGRLSIKEDGAYWTNGHVALRLTGIQDLKDCKDVDYVGLITSCLRKRLTGVTQMKLSEVEQMPADKAESQHCPDVRSVMEGRQAYQSRVCVNAAYIKMACDLAIANGNDQVELKIPKSTAKTNDYSEHMRVEWGRNGDLKGELLVMGQKIQ